MSTLTKILIVLLTLSSIFLCGIVVTYVANAGNYRQQYKDLKDERDALKRSNASIKKQLNTKTAESQQLEERLKGQIAKLNTELGRAKNNLKNAEREKAKLLTEVNSFGSITASFAKTTQDQKELFEKTQAELNAVKADQIKQKKALDETSAELLERMAIIETLEADRRRLLEEKVELQNELDRQLQRVGKEAVPVGRVTPRIGKAHPRPVVETLKQEIGLQGLVSKADLKNSLAEISIGTSDGVREGMKFFVTRGDQFICEILVIDVDAEKAVGILDRVEQQPKVGDKVVTNL